MALFCINCGTENSEENEYCSICGVRLPNSLNEGATMRIDRIVNEIEASKENEVPISVMIEQLLNEVKSEIDDVSDTKEPNQTVQYTENSYNGYGESNIFNKDDRYSVTAVIDQIKSKQDAINKQNITSIENEPIYTDNEQSNESQEEGEWLNDEAVREIWGISGAVQTENDVNNWSKEEIEPQPLQDNDTTDDEQMLPDGTPEWLSQIRQEEEQEELERKQEERQKILSFFNHPILITSIVALVMAVASASMVLSVFKL